MAAEEYGVHQVWTRGFRREGVGYQALMLPNEPRAPLEVNDGKPLPTRLRLTGTFGSSVDRERLDIPQCGASRLAFRAERSDQLEPLLAPYGEFHDCDTELGPMRIFRCLNVVDALASDVEIFVKEDGFGLTKEYRFDLDRLPRGQIFTLPHQRRVPRVFYPRVFIDQLDDFGISYSPFALVFDSATGFAEVANW